MIHGISVGVLLLKDERISLASIVVGVVSKVDGDASVARRIAVAHLLVRGVGGSARVTDLGWRSR